MNYKKIFSLLFVIMMIVPMFASIASADDSLYDKERWISTTDGTIDETNDETIDETNDETTVDEAANDSEIEDTTADDSEVKTVVYTNSETHPYEYNPEYKTRQMNTFQTRYGEQSLYYDSEYLYFEQNGQQYVFNLNDIDEEKREKIQQYITSTQEIEETVQTLDENEIKDLMYEFDEESKEGEYQNKKIVIDVEEMNADLEKMNEKEEIIFKEAFIRTSDISQYENIEIIEIFEDGYLIKFPITEMGKIASSPYTLKIVDKHSMKESRQQEQLEIQEQYQESKVERETLEVTPSEIKEAKKIAIDELEKQGITITETEGNPFSWFFIGEDNLPVTSTPEEAFEIASGIVYIHDIDLWGINEKWIPVSDVFTKTPEMDTNPSGVAVSDCEEHAMTLVKLLREQGVPATDVRVVTGLVEVDGKFGHAWVQMKNEDDLWQNFEPTSGTYIENGQVITATSIPYNYYAHRDYPAVEIWSYFNDEYYVDNDGGNAPEDWEITATSYSVGSTVTMSWYDDVYIFIDWVENEMYKLRN